MLAETERPPAVCLSLLNPLINRATVSILQAIKQCGSEHVGKRGDQGGQGVSYGGRGLAFQILQNRRPPLSDFIMYDL